MEKSLIDEYREETGKGIFETDWKDWSEWLEAKLIRARNLLNQHKEENTTKEEELERLCKTCGDDNSQLGFCARCDTDAFSY